MSSQVSLIDVGVLIAYILVNCTDDGAPSVKGDSYGIPWIRGTWLDRNDLPLAAEKP